MSIKTYQDDLGKRILIGIALSVALHGAAIWALISIKPATIELIERLAENKDENITVDVIELPPDAKGVENVENKKARYSADKTVFVEKDTYPEASLPSDSVIIPGNPGQIEAKRSTHAVSPDGNQGDKPGKAAQVRSGNEQGEPGEETYYEPGKTGSGDKQGLPNLFPSEERLAQLEKKYLAQAPKGEKGKTLSLNTTESKYQRYLLGMKSRIQFNWEYPEPAVRRGWQGSLKLDFTIKKDGTISDIRLEKSSNYPVLDEAAITAIRLSAPFPPFPENFSVDDLTIKAQFEYNLMVNPREAR